LKGALGFPELPIHLSWPPGLPFMSLSDHSSPTDGGISTAQANPSVSKAQWANYALRKLREGYMLIQTANGRVFHFYRAGEPLQPCATHAAKKLIEVGMLTVMKTDIRGTHYGLPAAFQTDASPSA
jgi:hypothetical protein